MSKTQKTPKLVPVEKVVILYACPECKATAEQPLDEIVQSGTAVCTECDCDMELQDNVKILD